MFPLTRAYLQEQYVQKARTVAAIARETGRSAHTVRERVQRYGLVRAPMAVRSSGEGDLLGAARLQAWYVEEELSLAEIARRLGVSTSVIRQALDRHGIPRRQGSAWLKTAPLKASRQRARERRQAEVSPADRALLSWMADGLRQIEAAQRLGVSPATISLRLKRLRGPRPC